MLENLIDICKRHTMEVTVFAHGEQIAESGLLLFKNRVLDGCKLGRNVFVLDGLFGESSEHFHGFLLMALQDEPTIAELALHCWAILM